MLPAQCRTRWRFRWSQTAQLMRHASPPESSAMDQAHQQERLDSPEASAEINALSIRLRSAAPPPAFSLYLQRALRKLLLSRSHTEHSRVSEREVSINPGWESAQHATRVYIHLAADVRTVGRSAGWLLGWPTSVWCSDDFELGRARRKQNEDEFAARHLLGIYDPVLPIIATRVRWAREICSPLLKTSTSTRVSREGSRLSEAPRPHLFYGSLTRQTLMNANYFLFFWNNSKREVFIFYFKSEFWFFITLNRIIFYHPFSFYSFPYQNTFNLTILFFRLRHWTLTKENYKIVEMLFQSLV